MNVPVGAAIGPVVGEEKTMGGPTTVRALLACGDDSEHALVLDYLAAGLGHDGIEVERAAFAQVDAAHRNAPQPPRRDVDVVVAYIDEVTIADAVEYLRRARDRWPRCGLIGVSYTPDVRLFAASWRRRPAGARFITLSALSSPADLSGHVHAAARHPYAEVAPVDVALPLTAAQVEILGLVAEGLTNAEIAQQRRTTETAVRNMVSRIAKRLEMSDGDALNLRVRLTRYLLVDHAKQRGERRGGQEADGRLSAAV